MSKFTSRADLLIAAGESIKMQEKAGIDPVCKRRGDMWSIKNLSFTCDDAIYELPLAVVEGKPVFVGDELWHDHYGKCVAISYKSPFKGNEAYCSPDNAACFSWNPPKPKTVNVELIVEDAATMLGVIEIYQEYCQSKESAKRVYDCLDKALKSLEKA